MANRIGPNLPNELRLLLVLIKNKSLQTEQEIQTLVGQTIDWDRFLELAYRHRLYPVAAFRMKEYEQTQFPADVIKQMNQMYVRNTFQMLQLTAEMEKVCRALEECHIHALVLKGPVLAEALYGDFSLRTSKDIDLLVAEGDVEQAETLIIQLGFKPDKETQRILNSVIRKDHHIGYTHPVSGVQVELHWRMSPDTYREPNFSELWERRRSTKKTSYPVNYLGQEDLYIYLVLHGARHGWFRLRWLVDIDRMIQQGLNWDIVFEGFQFQDSMHISEQALLLSEGLLHSSITDAKRIDRGTDARPDQLVEEALKMITELIYIKEKQTTEEARAYFERYNMLLIPSQQKWKQMLNTLYPSVLDAETLPLPRWLHFMYFPLRPFLWAWRKKKQRATA